MRKIAEEQKEIEVLLVDDHQMMRERLRDTINKQQNLAVIGEASNGEEAIIFVEDYFPDIIVMDVNMPVMDGIEATKIIMDSLPNVDIIGLSLYDSSSVKEDMHRAGASAYLPKNKVSESLCAAIQSEAK